MTAHRTANGMLAGRAGQTQGLFASGTFAIDVRLVLPSAFDFTKRSGKPSSEGKEAQIFSAASRNISGKHPKGNIEQRKNCENVNSA